MKIEIEFFDAKKVRPTESQILLCVQDTGYICELPYSVDYDTFNCRDDNSLEQACMFEITVDYWAYKPKFEKE